MSDEALPRPPRRFGLALFAWLIASFLGTLCGIGGGIFAVPTLHYLVRLPFQMAVGTSLVLVFAMTAVATVVELMQPDSGIDWLVVALLLTGSIPGAHLGFAVGRKIDTRTLKVVFIVLMLGAALKTLTLSGAALADHAAGNHVDLVHGLLVVLIGLGGGFLAPLLGIGGGLVVVPALFLTVPNMNYLEARACSIAMSFFNAGQSMWLHLKGRTIHFPTAMPFTLVAVVGAVLGVWAVHRPGWSEIARVTLTVVLIAVAGRLTWDVAHARWIERARQ